MLRPKKHITRQKIKEDKFVTQTLQIADWIKKHQRPLLAGAVGIVVVGVLITSWITARRSAEQEASLLVLQAGIALDEGRSDQARVHLEAAQDRFQGSESAGRALLMLAGLHYQEGRIDTARVSYDDYLRKYSKSRLLTAAARAGLAACLESEGDWLQAARLWQQAAEEVRNEAISPQYYLQAARCYREAGRATEALNLYDRIRRDYPGRSESDRAGIERAILARSDQGPQG